MALNRKVNSDTKVVKDFDMARKMTNWCVMKEKKSLKVRNHITQTEISSSGKEDDSESRLEGRYMTQAADLSRG